MSGIPSFLADSPFFVIVGFLVVVVFFRSQATYWLGRLIATGILRKTEHSRGWRARLHAWFEGAGVQRGVGAVEKWGLIIIPLSFITWGFQTLVQAGAGLLRLKWWLYTLAAIPGYFAWAIIYASAGFSLVKTVQKAFGGNPWAIALITLLVAALGLIIFIRRFRLGRAAARATAELKP